MGTTYVEQIALDIHNGYIDGIPEQIGVGDPDFGINLDKILTSKGFRHRDTVCQYGFDDKFFESYLQKDKVLVDIITPTKFTDNNCTLLKAYYHGEKLN